MFAGYPPTVKGYKLYDIESKSFFISRNVEFHEHIFPFQSAPHTTDIIDPFPDTLLPRICHDLPSDHPHTNSSCHINHNDIHNDTGSSYIHGPETVLHQESNFVHPLLPMPRKSNRMQKAPSYLRDYHCNLITNNSPPQHNSLYPLCKSLSYKAFSSSHHSLLFNISSTFDPQFIIKQ